MTSAVTRDFPTPLNFNVPTQGNTVNTPLRTNTNPNNMGDTYSATGQRATHVTRVMSPTPAEFDGASGPNLSLALAVPTHTMGVDVQPDQQVVTFLGRGWADTVPCPRCTVVVNDPYICSACGCYGHAGCLGIEIFEGLPFCGECFTGIVTDFANRRDAEMRESWRQSRAQQLLQMRSQAVNSLASLRALETCWVLRRQRQLGPP